MLKTRSTSRLLAAASATRRGFTLLEILVAVGAVALVSVGIAAIFDSVGKTVSAGRRISRSQMIATRAEMQIRRDFAQITREGFLIIRQQPTSALTINNNTNNSFYYASSKDVRISDRDADAGKAQRDRRIDEVMFFAKGKFTSAMEPLSEDYVAKSDEAAIYYGHGERRAPEVGTPDLEDLYKTPRLDDDIAVHGANAPYPLSIALGAGGVNNPNRYASDWILVRKPILLIQPRTAQDTPHNLPENPPLGQLRDSDVQIAGQPAASSIFQRLSRIYPVQNPSQTATNPASVAYWARDAWNPMTIVNGAWQPPPLNAASCLRPQIASGLVDIATTDLAEIRAIINMCPARPAQIWIPYDSSQPPYSTGTTTIALDDTRLMFPDPASTQYTPWQFPVGQGRWTPANDVDFGVGNAQGSAVYRMHCWMENALPNRSDGFTEFYEQGRDYDPRAAGCRVRCESNWTSRDDVMRVTGPSGPPTDARATYYKRRNQLALSAHNFIEHCSEFMIEWSFGLTDPRTGKVIWYGTPMQEPNTPGSDLSREMTLYRGDAQPIDPSALPSGFDLTTLPYNPFQGMTGLPTQLSANPALVTSLDPHSIEAYRVSKHLIYGNHVPFAPGAFPTPADSDGCFTSHFGYFDPSFDPQKTPVTLPGETASPSFESLGISSLPWAWPKMLRFTIRIADETDPTIEDTFQFIIDLPATPHP